MNLKQLQYFVVSVDVNSLTKAAELLYTTQPNVSKTIDKLEKELGKTLLIRSKTGVVLTKDGEEVYRLARKVLQNAEGIRKYVEQKHHQIFAVSSMPSRVTATLFAEYYDQLEQEERDALEMRFLEGSLEMVLVNVTHHHAAYGFIYVSQLQREALNNALQQKRLEFHEICESEFRLYVGPKNLFYDRESVTVEELTQIGLVQNAEDQIPLLDYPGHLNNQGVRKSLVHKAAEVNSDHAMIQMLLRTNLGNLSNHIMNHLTEESTIHSVKIRNHDVKAYYGYVTKKHAEFTETELDFLDYIKKRMLESR